MASPPRYSLDEEEQFISGSGKVQHAEDHPLLLSSGADNATTSAHTGGRSGFGGTFEAQDEAGPSASDLPMNEGEGRPRRAIYGKLTTLYTFHPLYIIDGTTETCINVLGKDRQDTIRILRRAFPVLDDYPDERIQLKVSRAAMGVGEAARGEESEGGNSGSPSAIPAPEDFDTLYWYPPEDSDTRKHLHGLVEIMDDAWGFLRQVPPGRVRVFVRPTEAEKYKAWRREFFSLHIFLGIVFTSLAGLGATIIVMAARGLFT